MKECGKHEEERRKVVRRVLWGMVGFILVVLMVILLIWIILRPRKPRFILEDATVYGLKLSSSTQTMNMTMQVTVMALNPNKRIGIYYTKLDAYASYRGQQVSMATALPPTYQGHRETTVWSPFLYGAAVPVSPLTLQILQQDKVSGGLLLNVKVNGRLKWKVGTWLSALYHLNVNCPAYIKLPASPPAVLNLQLFHPCILDV
ncbi:hypothetical protein VNO78_36774 [Psophocarpus tetragonolobus]|uniref:Late embryogenesis abundant protein LEA-2 subgroup domain-containing protein n=1 Tax=Psophocarpus tetragonolobus TaxID=3891 RepID=A0AAN9NDZ5_PSOTE